MGFASPLIGWHQSCWLWCLWGCVTSVLPKDLLLHLTISLESRSGHSFEFLHSLTCGTYHSLVHLMFHLVIEVVLFSNGLFWILWDQWFQVILLQWTCVWQVVRFTLICFSLLFLSLQILLLNSSLLFKTEWIAFDCCLSSLISFDTTWMLNWASIWKMANSSSLKLWLRKRLIKAFSDMSFFFFWCFCSILGKLTGFLCIKRGDIRWLWTHQVLFSRWIRLWVLRN